VEVKILLQSGQRLLRNERRAFLHYSVKQLLLCRTRRTRTNNYETNR